MTVYGCCRCKGEFVTVFPICPDCARAIAALPALVAALQGLLELGEVQRAYKTAQDAVEAGLPREELSPWLESTLEAVARTRSALALAGIE